MAKGSLEIVENNIVFKESNGGIIKLNSIDIYRLIFSSHDELELIRPPKHTCPEIIFQSAVRTVGMRIYVSSTDQVLAVAALKLLDNEYDIGIELDHCIIDNNWYPLEPESFRAVKNYLQKKKPAELAYKMDLQGYSDLYQFQDRIFPIYDNISDGQWDLLLESKPQPPELELKLYPYQLVGFRWLSTLVENGAGCILADEMGLGKTPQIISLLCHIQKPGVNSSLLVVPLTLIENWRRELQRFAPHLRFYVHHGDARVNLAQEIPIGEADLVITTYDTMVRDSYILSQPNWNLMLVDEAQAIKNTESQRTTVSKKISAKAKIAITGTPLENRPEDLWSLGEFANPGIFGPMETFKELSDHTPENIPKILKSVLLRREAKDVLKDLPELISMDLPLPMYPNEKSFYMELLDNFKENASSNINLGALTTLRRSTAHPGLIEDDFFKNPLDNSAKLTRLFEDLSEIKETGEKAIVSCEWTVLLELISSLSKSELGIPSWIINGATPASDRQKMVDQFSGSPNSAVLAINPHAAGVGLNIQAASHVFHYTLPWNPAIEDQVTKRAQRIGQTRPVVRHRPYYYGTIDEVIWNLLSRKRALFNNLVPENNQIPPIDVLMEILNTVPSGGN